MTGLAAPFKLHNPREKSITEYNIRFDDKKNSLSNLIKFAEEYNNCRINLEFVQGVDSEVLKVLTAVHSDIAVRLKDSDYLAIEKLQEEEYQFFIDQYTMPVCNYTLLADTIDLGVSDIYIYDDLCYDLPRVSEICKKNGVKIRMVLNKIPGTSFNRGHDISSPIYRPQDFNLLSNYIDVIEFDCGDPYNWAVFDVLYEVWFEKHKWIGDLREINFDLGIDFPNESVLPHLTEFKIKCNKRCAKDSSCRKCRQWVEIGQELASKEIAFRVQNE